MTTMKEAKTAEPLVDEARAPVMGTESHVVVVDGTPAMLGTAVERLRSLESRWSRFRADSEVSRLNASAGTPVVVSPETFALVDAAVAAFRATEGRFDPTVEQALTEAGYDRSFELLTDREGGPGRARPAPGCDGVILDPVVRAVTLPSGVAMDLGGIAKGFAADLVVDELRRAGAAGACVTIGGDLRVEGTPPRGVWSVEVEHPVLEVASAVIGLSAGAVATTSRTRRSWRRGGRTLHHVIDPRTGSSADSPWFSATVVAARGVDAEVLATVAFLSTGPEDAERILATRRASGLLVDRDGVLVRVAGIEAFLVGDDRAARDNSR